MQNQVEKFVAYFCLMNIIIYLVYTAVYFAVLNVSNI
jgi:hypothetical protein